MAARSLATRRRLAGFRFEATTPPPDDVLPRMDVGVFVGFAASGPLQTPVAIESPAQFADLFGADAPLAWDPERSETVYAHLGPAIRAFFRSGGKRCWVIRVGGAAVSNNFVVPGLAWLRTDGTIVPACLRARSEGSWSDGMRVAATLEKEVIACESIDAIERKVGLNVAAADAMAVGDLLRISYEAHGYLQFFAVQSLRPAKAVSPPTQAVVDAHGTQAIWLQSPAGKQPTTDVGSMVWFVAGVPTSAMAAYVAQTNSAASPIGTLPDWPTPNDDPTVHIDIAGTIDTAPLQGSLVRFEFAGDVFWLVVSDAFEQASAGSPVEKRVRLSGQGYWQLPGPPADLPAEPTAVERLTFDLWVRQQEEYPIRLSGLGFAPGHPLFWADLPTDGELYGDDQPTTALTTEVTTPRFPLAGGIGEGTFSFPLAMAFLAESFVGPDRVLQTALERDGLASFDARLFLGDDDEALRALLAAGTNRVMEVADFLRYQAPTVRSLQGIYAALAIDEATWIAVPDLLQRGWQILTPTDPNPPQNDPAAPDHAELFARCERHALAIPALQTDAPLAPTGRFHEADQGTFGLSWPPIANADFELQEAIRHDFTDAATVYTGKSDRFDIYGHRPGDYYYRVRVRVNGVWSDWSPGLVVRVASASDWQQLPAASYRENTLLVVQRALLRMCASRGDLLAVLGLPSHYREDDAIAHVSKLTSAAGPNLTILLSDADPTLAAANDLVDCLRLSDGESATPSYGAIYHPWFLGREEGQTDALRLVPPDGAVCGILAKRAIARGAWVAPANEPIAGPVALNPVISPDRWLDLLDAQVNVVRAEPRGFLALSADTLSADDALRPINVRRLLVLLRRLALRLGADYVFEPNDNAFRRAVQRTFESMMEFMFARGAFAGRTPADSFQVTTGSAVNTPRDQDEGRYFVELRVAPSLPLTFLTIRLVQSGTRGTVTEVI